MAGIISWGIGCNKADVPGVYASIRNSLCFIDWDTKCKHKNEFIGHYDYFTECHGWIDDEIAKAEENSAIFRKRLRKLKELKDTCLFDPTSRPTSADVGPTLDVLFGENK